MTKRLCISSDSHVVEPAELFEPLQKLLGDRAPRMVYNEGVGHQLSLGNGKMGMSIGGFFTAGMNIYTNETRALARQGYAIARPGCYDVKERLTDQDRDGVAAEVLYPSIIFNVYQIEDVEVIKATFAAYNDWLFDYMKPAPQRLFGLAAIQLRDIDGAIGEMQRTKEMGFAGVCIPCTAPPDHPYGDRFYDPFWAAAQELDMPLTMHIFTGATPNHGMPNWPGVSYPLAYMGMEVSIATLIANGVCERYPNLKFVPTEFETGWVANMLRRLDHSYFRSGGFIVQGVPLPMKPSDYWRRQFFVTFEDDPLGIRSRDFIGVQNLMWGSDYPHGDSVFPHSQQILDEVFQGVPDEERQAITAGNVIRLYHLPFSQEQLAAAA